MSFTTPLSVPEIIGTVQTLITGIDQCLFIGIGRLGPDQIDTLTRINQLSVGSPLEKPVTAAIEAIGRNEFQDKHFAAIAAMRCGLQGAISDHLRTVAATAMGRTPPIADDPIVITAANPDGPIGARQESARNWLMELAIAGLQNLEASTINPFFPTLEKLQDEPAAARLSALLTGFVQELTAALPLTDASSIPLYRWTDLWSRSLILASRSLESASGTKVSGSFSPLGVDLRHHGFFVNADVYGVLDTDRSQWVKVSIASYKVDVLVGPEMVRVFENITPMLWEALKTGKSLKIADCTLTATGQLRLDGTLNLGGPIDFTAITERFAIDSKDVPVMYPIAAADRHPMHIAEPITLSGAKVIPGSTPRLEFADGTHLPIASKRMSPASEVTVDSLKKCDRIFGLLRFDGGQWSIQPLMGMIAAKKGSEIRSGAGIAEAATKKKGDTLEQLQERASRLLRAKAQKVEATP